METQQNISESEWQKKYLESLTEKEYKAYEIARSHLGLSFQLEKSIGYIEWKNKTLLLSSSAAS